MATLFVKDRCFRTVIVSNKTLAEHVASPIIVGSQADKTKCGLCELSYYEKYTCGAVCYHLASLDGETGSRASRAILKLQNKYSTIERLSKFKR